MSTEQRLEEREKELACIYSICLLAAGAPAPEAAAEGVARALRGAMQHEESASCSLRLEHRRSDRRIAVTRGPAPGPGVQGLDGIEARFQPESSGGWEGILRVEYRRPGISFLPQERALLESVLVVTSSMLRTASLIAELRAASQDLAAKNVALREVVAMVEEERRRALLAYKERLEVEIGPLLERAREPALAPERRDAYLGLLADELEREARGLGPAPLRSAALSLREREIALQVRNGRTSKEIADLLGIAEATVERHRHNIRRKLKIGDRGINLASLLGGDEPELSRS